MARVDDIAAALLDRTGPMTAMKLEKLVYYVQSWHLAELGAPAFDEPIEAWKDGPVVRRLFEQHRGLRRVASWVGDPAGLPASVRRIVDRVARTYGRYTAEDLSRIAHREMPWRRARRGLPEAARTDAIIDRAVMADFYRRQAGGSADRMVQYAIASGRLEGASDPTPGEVETLLAVADGRLSVDDAVAEVLAPYR